MKTIMNTILTGIIASLLFISPAWAADAASASGLAQLVPLILIMLIFYFLLIRPQQKRAKEHKDMVESLKKGDKVVTNGGIYGTLVDVKEDTVKMEVADGVRIKIQREAIVALSD
jgi:preprotein translocase subunit YajC